MGSFGSAPPPRNRLMIIVGSAFLAVGLVLGTVLVLIGSKDYSSYTGRASATVVDVDVHTTRNSQGRTNTTRSYDVQFTAEGRTIRINDIGGVRSGDPGTGAVVGVVFPPGQPEIAVWANTVEGGAQLLVYIGIGIGAVFGVLGAVIAILGSRRRSHSAAPVGTADRISGPVLADPGSAAEIGRPWTFDEVVGNLVRRTEGTPYAVGRSGNSVSVRVDLADASWWALLQRQGLTRSYSSTLTPVGPAKAARADAQYEFEWAAGPDGRLAPVATGSMSMSGGRSFAVASEQIWALGPGGVQQVVDYRLDSGELHGLIAATLNRAGWSTALDTQARIGLWVAIVAVAGVAVAGVLAVIS